MKKNSHKYYLRCYSLRETVGIFISLISILIICAALIFEVVVASFWLALLPAVAVIPFTIQPWRRVWHGGWEDKYGYHWFIDEQNSSK